MKKNKLGVITVEMLVYLAISVFILIIVIGFASGAFQKLLLHETIDFPNSTKFNCETIGEENTLGNETCVIPINITAVNLNDCELVNSTPYYNFYDCDGEYFLEYLVVNDDKE